MSIAISRSHARGPLTLIANTSNICSGVSWATIDVDAVCVGVPKLPSRSSVAPARKKLRHVAVLGSVRELLEGVGVQLTRTVVVLVGEDRVIEQSCRPTEVTVVEGLLRDLDDLVDAAHRRHVPRGDRLRRMLPQPTRVAVEPAHVALIDRLDVVAHRPVVAVGVPRFLERRRHREVLGDLDTGEALVELPQRLVVKVGVQIPLQRQEFDDPVLAPGGPVMRGEHHVGAVDEGVDGLGEVARPAVRVTHQGATQGQQVVQVVRRVLGHAQRAVSREVEVHLGGRLGARRHLELDLHAVDGVLLAGCRGCRRSAR